MTLTIALGSLAAGVLGACPARSPSLAAAPSPAVPYAFSATVTGRGAPMILIPGLMSAGAVWNGVAAHYAGRREVHVLTLAGFAGEPPVEGGPFLERVRDDVVRYIRDRRLDRPVLVGHSLGGFLAFSVASHAPELVGPVVAVDGVPFIGALADTAATPAAMRAAADRARDAYAALTPARLEEQTRPGLPGMVTDPRWVDTLAAWSRRSDPATVGRAVAEMLTTDLRAAVAAIRTRVLLVAAAGLVPEGEMRARARATYAHQVARVRDHEVVVAERSRHFVMLDDPAFLLRAMDAFLTRAGAP